MDVKKNKRQAKSMESQKISTYIIAVPIESKKISNDKTKKEERRAAPYIANHRPATAFIDLKIWKTSASSEEKFLYS